MKVDLKNDFSNLKPKDKVKLAVAGGMLLLAVVFLIFYFTGGDNEVPPEAVEAQEKILEQMPASQTPPEVPEERLPSTPEQDAIPTGRPRSVGPG